MFHVKQNKHMIILKKEEEAVLRIIKNCTSENKILDPQIRQLVKVADPESDKKGAGLRRVINSLRQKGFAICSDTGGYWYAQSWEELNENINALIGRATKIMIAAQGMKKALDNFNEVQKQLDFI